MKNLCFAFIFLNFKLLSQQGIVASGNESTGIGGSTSTSIGQVDYIYETGTNGSINQGVQQPYEFYSLDMLENSELFPEITIYPNPTSKDLVLQSQNHFDLLFYQLKDVNGKEIMSAQIDNYEITIPMENLPRSAYFITIIGNSGTSQTLKIIKN